MYKIYIKIFSLCMVGLLRYKLSIMGFFQQQQQKNDKFGRVNSFETIESKRNNLTDKWFEIDSYVKITYIFKKSKFLSIFVYYNHDLFMFVIAWEFSNPNYVPSDFVSRYLITFFTVYKIMRDFDSYNVKIYLLHNFKLYFKMFSCKFPVIWDIRFWVECQVYSFTMPGKSLVYSAMS